jgi:hypothetical protein
MNRIIIKGDEEFQVEESRFNTPADVNAIKQFLNALYPRENDNPAKVDYILLLLKHAKDANIKIIKTSDEIAQNYSTIFKKISFATFRSVLPDLFKSYPEYHFYFAVNNARSNKDVEYLYALFLDFDNPNVDVFEKIKEAGMPNPTATVKTLRGVQLHWFFNEPLLCTSDNRALYELSLKKLSRFCGSDTLTIDCSRKMRLPGSPYPCWGLKQKIDSTIVPMEWYEKLTCTFDRNNEKFEPFSLFDICLNLPEIESTTTYKPRKSTKGNKTVHVEGTPSVDGSRFTKYFHRDIKKLALPRDKYIEHFIQNNKFSEDNKERHTAMLGIANALAARYRFDEEEFKATIHRINELCCIPPKDADEIDRIADSAWILYSQQPAIIDSSAQGGTMTNQNETLAKEIYDILENDTRSIASAARRIVQEMKNQGYFDNLKYHIDEKIIYKLKGKYLERPGLSTSDILSGLAKDARGFALHVLNVPVTDTSIQTDVTKYPTYWQQPTVSMTAFRKLALTENFWNTEIAAALEKIDNENIARGGVLLNDGTIWCYPMSDCEGKFFNKRAPFNAPTPEELERDAEAGYSLLERTLGPRDGKFFRYLVELMAYGIVCQNRRSYIALLRGATGAGKTTFLKLMRKTFSEDIVRKTNPSSTKQNTSANEQSPFVKAASESRITWIEEPSSLNESLLKLISSGDDGSVDTKVMYNERRLSFTSLPCLTVNKLPAVQVTDALLRRIRVFNFENNVITKKTFLKSEDIDKLIEQHPFAIVAVLWPAIQRMLAGDCSVLDEMDASPEFNLKNSMSRTTAQEFVDDYLVFPDDGDDDAVTPERDIKKAYREYCEKNKTKYVWNDILSILEEKGKIPRPSYKRDKFRNRIVIPCKLLSTKDIEDFNTIEKTTELDLGVNLE